MNLYYKKDGTPYEGKNAHLDWLMDMEDTEARRVGQTNLPNGLHVSTVWLGLDHSFGYGGPPLIFETMVFLPNSLHELDMKRYSTWDQALKGHERMVAKYKSYKTADEVLK